MQHGERKSEVVKSFALMNITSACCSLAAEAQMKQLMLIKLHIPNTILYE